MISQKPVLIAQSPMITEENEESDEADDQTEDKATAQCYSMRSFVMDYDQFKKRNISLIISKDKLNKKNNQALLSD